MTESPTLSSRPVRIDDLARSLGLSKGTVSRALNGYSDISPATRKRVAEAAEALGYRPMAHAQAIKTGRVRALGLVLQMDQHDAQAPFLAGFLHGITRAASAHGWTLTVSTAESEEEGLEVYRRIRRERKADGFILPRTRLSDPRIDLLREEGCPFVLFGRTGDPTGCAWFDIRSEDAMADAVTRLAALGHRRIAHLGGDTEFTYAHLRAEGVRAGLTAAGLPVDDGLFRLGNATRDDAARSAGELLDDMHPTAIVCATDVLALGALKALADRGLVPGRDVSVVGYDGLAEGRAATVPLSTYAVDQVGAGGRLADILIERIRGAAPDSLRETAMPEFYAGGTIGPPV
ncbi:LacI family DNA-binding transcriptional regulator [Litorisediminicola beolgyonensis]|uniref:LacI family DNA-binding transcriptional regulator n=1 Tax=Litorisediminicola beolgyonensis TaxID=1173614 RepID=A0ABW3ZJ87_9RHOB